MTTEIERIERSQPLTINEVVGRITKIQEAMSTVMKDGIHYGKIPGTPKPTLYQAGADVLNVMFRFAPVFKLVKEVQAPDFIYYMVECTLILPDGSTVGTGLGACNSRENKYRWRFIPTNKPVPKAYWDNGRDLTLIGGPDFIARKEDDGYWIFKKVENDNPWDQDNTILKMAAKRAKVAATINATSSSDMFTQDMEDYAEFSAADRTGPKADPSKSLQDNKRTETGSKADRSGKMQTTSLAPTAAKLFQVPEKQPEKPQTTVPEPLKTPEVPAVPVLQEGCLPQYASHTQEQIINTINVLIDNRVVQETVLSEWQAKGDIRDIPRRFLEQRLEWLKKQPKKEKEPNGKV